MDINVDLLRPVSSTVMDHNDLPKKPCRLVSKLFNFQLICSNQGFHKYTGRHLDIRNKQLQEIELIKVQFVHRDVLKL